LNFFSLFKRNLIFKFKKKINIDNHNFEKNIKLEKLFSFYKTDKANFIEKEGVSGHGFSEFYEKHFLNLKEKNLKILEIGSFSGASAAAFSKYFVNSEIYCLDVNLTKFIYQSAKIFPFGIDITNQKMVKKFLEKINFEKKISSFDIIIDDGSHLLSHQIKSLNYFFKYVKNGGFYVIEDFKFSEYFNHLKDTNELSINEIIKNIRSNQDLGSNIIHKETLELLRKNAKYIYDYKGNKKISDILFWQKLN